MNETVLGLGITTLAFGATSAYLWQEVRTESERREVAQARVLELERRLQSLERPVPELIAPVAQLSANVDAPAKAALPPVPRTVATAKAAPAETEPAIGIAPAGAMPPRLLSMLQDPESRALWRAQQKMSMTQMYSDLGATLNLQADELDKLLDLLAEHQVQSMQDMRSFAQAAGTPDANSQTDWGRRMTEGQRKRDADIAALLGDAKYQEWKDYQGSMGARMQVRQLRSVLESSPEPLRADQLQPLVTAIADEQRRQASDMRNEVPGAHDQGAASESERMASFERSLERTAQYNQRVRDAAAQYLSSQQLASFDQMLSRQLEMQRLSMQMMRAHGIGQGQTQIITSDGSTISQTTGTVLVPVRQ